MTEHANLDEDPHAPSGARWMSGRIALVSGGGLSGAAGGVGSATARLLADHGARVAVLDRDANAAEETLSRIVAAGGEAVGILGDATRDDDCRRAVRTTIDRFGGIDTLVNSAASGDRAGLFDVTPQRWDELVALNLTGAWLMTRHATSAMSGGAAVVNVSSVAVEPSGSGSVYGVAKAGVEHLTQAAAGTFGPRGIRVNCVRVGTIWSSMAERDLPADAREDRRLAVTLRTEGTAWDAAYAALFLASERARWISGQVLGVDGGGVSPRPIPSRSADAASAERAATNGASSTG